MHSMKILFFTILPAVLLVCAVSIKIMKNLVSYKGIIARCKPTIMRIIPLAFFSSIVDLLILLTTKSFACATKRIVE